MKKTGAVYSKKELRVMIVKMIQNLGNEMRYRLIEWRQGLKRYKKCLTRT